MQRRAGPTPRHRARRRHGAAPSWTTRIDDERRHINKAARPAGAAGRRGAPYDEPDTAVALGCAAAARHTSARRSSTMLPGDFDTGDAGEHLLTAVNESDDRVAGSASDDEGFEAALHDTGRVASAAPAAPAARLTTRCLLPWCTAPSARTKWPSVRSTAAWPVACWPKPCAPHATQAAPRKSLRTCSGRSGARRLL